MRPIAIATRARWAPLPILSAVFAFYFAPLSALAAECTNDAVRESQVSSEFPGGTAGLPGCLALEMVSPPKKFLQPAFGPVLFSRGGDRLLYRSVAALAGTQGLQNSVGGDFYISSRSPSAWTTAPTSPPTSAQIDKGSNEVGLPYALSAEMDRWILFGSNRPQNQIGALQFFEGGLDGSFLPRSAVLVPNDDSGKPFLNTNSETSPWRATSRDLSTTLFRPEVASTTLLPGDPGAGTSASSVPGGDRNEYVISSGPGDEPLPELLARDKDEVVHGGFCGTRIGGGVWGGGSGRLDQGAISEDGSQIYFTTRPDQPGEVAGIWPSCDTANPLRIMVRTMTLDGPEIAELIPGGPATGDDLYQGASADGTKVYFTTTRQLVAADEDTGGQCSAKPGQSDGCDLYLYDSTLPEGDRLVLVSADPDPTPQHEANVLSSITALSGDGSHLYFVAEEVLAANSNPEGATALDGEPNLYLYQRDAAHPDGTLSFVGVLSAEDEGLLWGVERSFAGGAYAVPLWNGTEGGDGHILLLTSSAPLTATDKDGGDRDVFRYDSAAATLQCVSCTEIEEPKGFDVSVNSFDGKRPSPNFTEPGRWVSEDGNTVAFATAESLVADDEDGAGNPYVWTEGQLAKLPGVIEAGQGVLLPAVSASGNGVAFSTTSALLWADGDTTRDVYVLRAGGGFSKPTPLPICHLEPGDCWTPSPPPGNIGPAFAGPGNVKAKQPKAKHKKRKQHKKQKHKGKNGKKRQGGNRK